MLTSPVTIRARRSPESSLESAPLGQEPSRPTQLPAFRKQELADTRAIAERVQDSSRSMRLEMMLRRQRDQNLGTLLAESRQHPVKLEHLAIALRLDQRYQLVIRGKAKPLSKQTFQTSHHCAAAAAELEQTFAMDWMLDLPSGEAMEQTEMIIQSHVWREWVALEMERTIT